MKRTLLLPLLVLPACTSVKVHKLADERFPKVPARQVERVNDEEAKQRPHLKVATIEMRTRSPFAADLPTLARERTGKLGGNAWLATGGNSQTIVTGGVGSLLGDQTSSSLNIEVLRWKDAPAPAPAKKKSAAGGQRAVAIPAPGAGGAAPPKPAKAKAWWRPWSWF